MSFVTKLKILCQRFHEYGFWKFTSVYANRLARATLPSCLFNACEGILLELTEICPEKIPCLRGFETRVATKADIPKLCSVLPRPKLFTRLFDSGSICTVAENSDGILAMVWARIGPVDCTVDASYRHGYRWRLEADHAWIHNGMSHPDYRDSGLYIVAYRKLLQELVKRGVSRCYCLIRPANINSLRIHNRLYMRPFANLSYRRILFCGRYQICHKEDTMIAWTIRRSFTINVSNLLKTFARETNKQVQLEQL